MARAMRKIVLIDEEKCTGCGDCILACAEGAIELVDGKARLITDSYCDGLGACLGECPADALKIIERDAEEFDPEAVERHLEESGQDAPHPAPAAVAPAGCPSARMRSFKPVIGEATLESGGPVKGIAHWPIQINLIPPNAPFLKNADLLVAADCVPAAYPGFHRDFVADKAVMIGCPKFDDTKAYEDKFTEIFKKAGVRSVTVVEMEVPCCSQLPNLVKKALKRSGADVPMEEVTISIQGRLKSRETVEV